MNYCKLQNGSTIVEIKRTSYDSDIYLTVSKQTYDEDAVQIVLTPAMAKAISAFLGDTE